RDVRRQPDRPRDRTRRADDRRARCAAASSRGRRLRRDARRARRRSDRLPPCRWSAIRGARAFRSSRAATRARRDRNSAGRIIGSLERSNAMRARFPSILFWVLFPLTVLAQQPPVPQPFPRPGAPPQAPPPVTQPAPRQPQPAAAEGTPTEATLGVPIYPGSQFLASYD